MGRAATESWIEPTPTNVKLVHALYLASFLVGLTVLAGLILAYVNRAKVARGMGHPAAATHYTYAIRTFWIGLLYTVITGVLAVVGIGLVLLPLVAVWFGVRCVRGLIVASRNEAIGDPDTWLI